MTTNLQTEILRLLLANYRRENPSARAPHIVVYADNGGSRKSRRCVLCGTKGPTWCAKYRKTRRASDWEDAHVQEHIEEAERKFRLWGRQPWCHQPRNGFAAYPTFAKGEAKCS
jgi:hypothetical protein